MATRYPYFNEESETNWKDENLNKDMEVQMKEAAVTTGYRDENGKWKPTSVDIFNPYKVHDMFEKRDDGSLEFISQIESKGRRDSNDKKW